MAMLIKMTPQKVYLTWKAVKQFAFFSLVTLEITKPGY